MMREPTKAATAIDAAVSGAGGAFESLDVQGRYTAVCRDKDGRVKWVEEFDNLVTDVGKRFILDTVLAGSAYTVTGPFMGLVGSGAASAAAGDTMASHAGWTEVGGTNAPAYTGNRLTVAWNAASGTSKSNSGTLTFTFTSGGTVGGCFLALGSGAVNTKDSTAGTLYSAGAFTGGSKTVANTDTLTVTYTASA